MRYLILAAVFALAACAMGGGADPDVSDGAPSPFPVQRGTAPPPPQTASTQSAPPEGRAPSGIDFGQWRTTDVTAYAAAFQTQIATREQGRDSATMRSDLQANGFGCEAGGQLDCRIEIMEQQCAHDWYVVIDAQGGVHAGYEKICLGARAS